MQSKASKAMQSKAKQSAAKQSKAKQVSKVKQRKAKPSKAIFLISLTKLCLEGFLLADLKNRAMVTAPGGSPIPLPGSPRQRKAKQS